MSLPLVSCDAVFTSLSSFQGGGFLWDLNSYVDPRKMIGFQFVQLYSCEDRNEGFPNSLRVRANQEA